MLSALEIGARRIARIARANKGVITREAIGIIGISRCAPPALRTGSVGGAEHARPELGAGAASRRRPAFAGVAEGDWCGSSRAHTSRPGTGRETHPRSPVGCVLNVDRRVIRCMQTNPEGEESESKPTSNRGVVRSVPNSPTVPRSTTKTNESNQMEAIAPSIETATGRTPLKDSDYDVDCNVIRRRGVRRPPDRGVDRWKRGSIMANGSWTCLGVLGLLAISDVALARDAPRTA